MKPRKKTPAERQAARRERRISAGKSPERGTPSVNGYREARATMGQTTGIVYDPTKSLSGGAFTTASRENQEGYLNKYKRRGYGEGQLRLPSVQDDKGRLRSQDAAPERQGFKHSNSEASKKKSTQASVYLDRNYTSPHPEGSDKDLAAKALMKTDRKISDAYNAFNSANRRIGTAKKNRTPVKLNGREVVKTLKRTNPLREKLGIDNLVPGSKMAVGARVKRALAKRKYNRNVRRYNNIIANAGSDAYYLPGGLQNAKPKPGRKLRTKLPPLNATAGASKQRDMQPLTRKEADYQLQKRSPMFGGPGVTRSDKYGYNSYTDNDGTYTNKEVKKTTGYRIPKKRK